MKGLVAIKALVSALAGHYSMSVLSYVFMHGILTTTLREGHAGPERLNRHRKVTQLVSGGAEVQESAVRPSTPSWSGEVRLGWEALQARPLA